MRDLHRRLAASGFGPHDDDAGTFGPATAASVRAFQRQRGLLDDGHCDEPTWLALV
ncbi:MAG: peptidoglycan-binding domain-containing protein, partial [Ilumatobacteraceae bacterium]